ncbi:MAG: RDD family protein [Candidatus Izemoplasmatales bacterium]|nr:RDD family protein [Candidatus Izemoplasmatales bacterium]
MNPFERRLRAFSIDISFATILFFVFAMIADLLGMTDPILKFYVSAATSYFGVLIVPNLISPGQTFGKRTQKIRVLSNKTDEVPPLWLLILREIVKGSLGIITWGFYLILSAVMVNARKDKRSIHDLIFGTKVVPITLYLSDKEEGYVLGRTMSANKNLEGSSHD